MAPPSPTSAPARRPVVRLESRVRAPKGREDPTISRLVSEHFFDYFKDARETLQRVTGNIDRAFNFLQGSFFTNALNQDLYRFNMAQAIRALHTGNPELAKVILERYPQDALAKSLLSEIQSKQKELTGLRDGTILRALVLDAALLHNYGENKKNLLLSFIGEDIAKVYSSNTTPPQSLTEATDSASHTASPKKKEYWAEFKNDISPQLFERLSDVLGEKNVNIHSEKLLVLARDLKTARLSGTAWTLAKLVSQYPWATEEANALLEKIEGRRLSVEYMLSDLLDQGGTVMAANLLALIPSVATTRYLLYNRFASLSPLVRIPASLAIGGAIHYAGEKGLLWATDFSGDFFPEGPLAIAGEYGASVLQVGLTTWMSRLFWRRPPLPVAQEAAVMMGTTEVTSLGRLARLRRTILRPLRWSGRQISSGARQFVRNPLLPAGLSLKALGTGFVGLASQLPPHYFGVRPMTQIGHARSASFMYPTVADAQREVGQTFPAKEKYSNYEIAVRGAGSHLENPIPNAEAEDLDLFINSLMPQGTNYESSRTEAAFVEFFAAARKGHLKKNIKLWLTKNVKDRNYSEANRVLKREDIHVRFNSNGQMCFPQSLSYPCPVEIE